MTMRVLQSEQQIADARVELVSREISSLDASLTGKVKRALKGVGIGNAMVVGDMVKSWDVLATIQFIEERLERDAPILDIGCYCSEVLVALHKAGFTKLTGVDLNPNISNMPFNDVILYKVSDFMETPFGPENFSAITSISVIEHGFDGPRLLAEASRILKPGGYFLASFDYWPDKIETNRHQFFGMDWLIFSSADVDSLIEMAAQYDLRPVGELQSTSRDRPIRHGGYEYTFAWMAFQKRA